jgi:hypothetical protein
MSSCTVLFEDMRLSYKTMKGKNFVFLLLGEVNKDGYFDARQALCDLGYVPDPTLEYHK